MSIEIRDPLNDQDAFDDDDNASVLVVILQCETRACDNNINKLKNVFSDPYFTVQVYDIDVPKDVTNVENYRMLQTLTYAKEGPFIINNEDGVTTKSSWWKDIPVIVIKDSSICSASFDPYSMKQRIKTALKKASNADLFFLCKWGDACDKFKTVEGDANLKWSSQPTAVQAVMYTPKARDFVLDTIQNTVSNISDVLNSNIEKGKLLSTVFVPNLIDYDINLATNDKDYAKLNECAMPKQNNQKNNNKMTFVWLAIIIIIGFLLAWSMLQNNNKLQIK